MIKVLHSATNWLAQTQTWMYNQVRFLPAEVENHILCASTANLDQFGLDNIHTLHKPSAGVRWSLGLCGLFGLRERAERARWTRALIRVSQMAGTDILHSHFATQGLTDMKAAKRSGMKHVVTFYGFDACRWPKVSEERRKLYSSLFESADLFVCEGRHMATTVEGLGCPADKIAVYHLGVDVDAIEYSPRIWKPAEPLKILIAASFREKKGIPYALEALGLLRSKTPLHITIIGNETADESSSDEKRKILETIDRQGLRPFTSLLGFQHHDVLFREAYSNHIFLAPSVTAGDGDAEGGAPVSIIEMAATGMPVVSSRHCDIPSVIIDGETGLLADERDAEGLYEHLLWLTRNQERWGDMTLAARRHVEREYNAVRQGALLMEIYKNILENT